MNFRLEYGNFETKDLLAKCTQLASNKRIDEALELLEKLQGYDQFHLSRNSNPLIAEYKEGRIKFLPTYKYDANSNIYDTSKKQRTPSWTDRIMWNCGDLKAQQLFYSRREYKESDHRPVVSYFIIEAKKIDKIKREKIMSQLHQGGGTKIRTTVREEEEVVQDEGSPYDEREYFADDPYMSASHNPHIDDNSNVATQQIQNKFSEINLLDGNDTTNMTNVQQQQQQQTFNNNPFNGGGNIFESFGGFGNFGNSNQGNGGGGNFNAFASFSNNTNFTKNQNTGNNYQPQQQSFNNNPFSKNTSNKSVADQIDLL